MRTKEEISQLRHKILELHNAGLSPMEMVRHVIRERSTIVYHLQQLGLKPHRMPRLSDRQERYVVQCPACKRRRVVGYGRYHVLKRGDDTRHCKKCKKLYDEDGVCRGRSYEDYLMIERLKKHELRS